MKQVTTWAEIWKVETWLVLEGEGETFRHRRDTLSLCNPFFHTTKRETYEAFIYFFRPEENSPTNFRWFDTYEERLTALGFMAAMVETGDFYYEPTHANAD